MLLIFSDRDPDLFSPQPGFDIALFEFDQQLGSERFIILPKIKSCFLLPSINGDMEYLNCFIT